MTESQKELIHACMTLAFESWRWRWQVDLEESMDNNFFDAMLMSIGKNAYWWLCSHTVARISENDRPVRYHLRSNEWREWVAKSSKESMENAFSFLIDNLWLGNEI